MYDLHLKCLLSIKPLLPPITDLFESLKSGEEETVSNIMSELSEEEKAELGPIKEATGRALYWTQQIINAPLSHGYTALKDYILPVSNPVLHLFFAVGCLIGISPKDMKDPGGDISWDIIKEVTNSLRSDFPF